MSQGFLYLPAALRQRRVRGSSLCISRRALVSTSLFPQSSCRSRASFSRRLCVGAPIGLDDLSRVRLPHRDALRDSVTVLPDFVSAEEELAVVRTAERHFAAEGLQYARGPGTATGGCIDCYREYDAVFDGGGDEEAAAAIRRLRGVVKMLALTHSTHTGASEGGFSLATMPAGDQTHAALNIIDQSVPNALLYPSYRVIDLAADGGVITPHVDDQTTFGRFILVLNLLTDTVIRLRALPPLQQGADWWPPEDEYADVAVPRRGVYLLAGLSRYAYTHEVLSGSSPGELLSWGGRSWRQGRRISVVVRDAGPGISPSGEAAFAPELVAGEPVGPGSHWPRRETPLDKELARRLGAWMDAHGPRPSS